MRAGMATAAGVIVAVAAGGGIAYLLNRPKTTSTTCPSGDVAENSDGSCPSGYTLDTSSTGCCKPVVGCPAGDLPENPDGSCPTDYIPDPLYPGCCKYQGGGGQCSPACTGCQECINGTCQTPSCTQNGDCLAGCTCQSGKCLPTQPPPAAPVLTVSPLSLIPSGSDCSGCFTLTVTGCNPGDTLLVYDASGTYWGSATANASGIGTAKVCVTHQTTAASFVFYVQDHTLNVNTNSVAARVVGGCVMDPCAPYACGKNVSCPSGCNCPSGGGTCYSSSSVATASGSTGWPWLDL